MNRAVTSMLERYERRSADDHVNALREILQEIALCGLWRAKYFERAAFYGGTALRVLHGLDRFSEDMDFSLLAADADFDLARYLAFVADELDAWGFATKVTTKEKTAQGAVKSASITANLQQLLLSAGVGREVAEMIHGRRLLKIRIEVDTEPPAGFSTETRFLLQPIPFSVKVFDPPSLFAGKMHAVLCRSWRGRVKGRDWYDLVWYVARGIPLDLVHLEARMRKSGHYDDAAPIDENTFHQLLVRRIENLDVAAARSEVERFLVEPAVTSSWSRELFLSLVDRIAVRSDR